MLGVPASAHAYSSKLLRYPYGVAPQLLVTTR
jgi:hypothetical protein